MKKIVFACIAALISATAFAATAYMDTGSRQISWTRPDKAVHPETKQEFKNPSDGTLAACGIVQVEYDDCDFKYRLWGWEPSPWCRAMNAAERQAVDDAEAQAQAEAEAQAAAFDFPDPEVIVPVLDANGERTGTARLLVDHAGQIVVVTDTASPQRTAAVQIAEFKAKRDAAAAKLAKAKAEANGQLQKRIENIESVLGIRE